uniref:Uncharacterized protein n=1 Tax=Tanacetum cinerariifolium TaxID=118510 RepID=A0A6L2K4I5_TANCI|nr:hypothetical protein [Tanacetum cinerariifolium]
MESLNSNSQEREIEVHQLQQMQDKAKESCMHMESLRESIQERAKHKREYDRRMNDIMMHSKEGNVDSSKALDDGLVVTKINETKSERHVSSSRSENDTHTADEIINSVNDKQPMAETYKDLSDSIKKSSVQTKDHADSLIVQLNLLKEVNSRVKIQSPKTRDSTKPVKPTSHTEKPSRKIVTEHRFSLNKSSAVHENINTPRSCLRWLPTGRIFNTDGLSVDHPVPEVIALIAEVVAPELAASISSPSSINVDQDAPSPSKSQTIPETQSPIIPNVVEEDNHDLDVAHMNNDSFFGISIPKVLSD